MKNINKFASFSIVFAPLLEPYVLPGTSINLDVAFLFITSIICLGNKRQEGFQLPYKLSMFIGYALIIPVAGLLYYSDFTGLKSSYISTILYVLNILLIIPHVKIEYVLKFFKYLVLVSGFVLIVQEFMFATMGYRFSALIPFLPIKYDSTTTDAYMQSQMLRTRSSSFFLEPAHLAQYLLAYLSICLANNIRNKKLISKSLLLTLLFLMLTWSGNAILVAPLLIIYYILFSEINISKKVFAIAIIFAGITYIQSTSKGSELLSRTEELSYDGSQRISSGTMRIFRGYYVFDAMPQTQKIAGVGSGYCSNVIEDSSSFWMFSGSERYINNIQELLIAYGIIGTFLFLLHLFGLYKYSWHYGRMLIIAFLGLCFIEQFWLGPKMFLYLGLAISFSRQQDYFKNAK